MDTVPRKEPAWLVAKMDQLEAKLEQTLRESVTGKLLFTLGDVIMCQLEEPPDDATLDEIKAWERTCSNCGVFCDGEFYLGQAHRVFYKKILHVHFGMCPTCKDIE